MTLHFLTFYH